MKITKTGEKYYKLALHLHTTKSDGRKTPEEVAKEYKLDGFDAIALTDHWVYGDGGNIEGLHIIPGCEYNIGSNETIEGVSHILSLFADSNPNIKRDAKPQEAVIIRKQQEALVNKYPELQQSSADAIAARKAEQDYQKKKTGYIGKIPHTFANDAAIDAQIQDILGLDETIMRDEDKADLIKELQGRKSTQQMIAEAKQSAVASHSGKKTTENLEVQDKKKKLAESGRKKIANGQPGRVTIAEQTAINEGY
jgi:hypothetical protein